MCRCEDGRNCALDMIHGGDASLACDSECYFSEEGGGTDHHRWYVRHHLGDMESCGLVEVDDLEYPIVLFLQNRLDYFVFKRLWPHFFKDNDENKWSAIHDTIEVGRAAVVKVVTKYEGEWKSVPIKK